MIKAKLAAQGHMDNPIYSSIFTYMADSFDILIVGGGLNGPALALALAKGGFAVGIVDALPKETRKKDGFDGRSYAMALASQRLLAALDVWGTVGQNAQPILNIVATDGHVGQGPSPFVLGFDHAEIEEGPMGYMIEDRYLRRNLMAAIDASPLITHLPGTTVVSQSCGAGSAQITLADGTEMTARLLIGADGRKSGVAQRAGIKRMGWDYGQTALVSAIAHEHPHEGTAHQFFMPSGPLAILPLPGNRSSIVWSETHAQAKAIAALDDDGYLEALRPRFGDFLGDISLTGERFSYPLSLSLTHSLIAPRVALIGDAGHGVHPIAGQGLNMGFRDVGALAEVLTLARRRGEDPGAPNVLARYQQWRRFDTVTMALATDGFTRLFSNDNPILRAGRDIGMGITNALPGLRRRLIREAAGLTGDIPKLLQGRAV